MGESWKVISDSEYALAMHLANHILESSNSVSECIANMFDVVSDMNHNTNTFMNIQKIELKKAFSDDNELSNNFIAYLSYLLSDELRLNTGNGVVLTSNILAEDMVRMSLVEWICSNSDYSKKKVADFIWGIDDAISQKEILLNKIRNIYWYDPCVGGGAFPLSVYKVLKGLGINGKIHLYGSDINPIYVAATKMRLALMSHGRFEDEYDYWNNFILCTDSLDLNLSQINFFDMKSEDLIYDIVIGNPPYVKSEKIEEESKNKYRKNYPEIFNKKADLYTYFIAHGLNSLNENGILTFVSPAQFQTSNYGRPIRELIQIKGGVCAVADFNELHVFKNVSIHASVYTLIRGKVPEFFNRFEYNRLPNINPLYLVYSKGWKMKKENISSNGWLFRSTDSYKALACIEMMGKKLKDCTPGVYSGIKSGCKKAYFVSNKDISEFENYDMTFVHKMIIPRKIKRWVSKWDEDYVLVIKKDEVLDEASKIFSRMLKFKDLLSNRSDTRGHRTWYGLRKCSYYDKFKCIKIIYPDIAKECRFSMDMNSMIVPDGAYFIPTSDWFLLGLLNSCIGRYYFREKCARIGNPNKGGRIRFKKIHVENFPVVTKEMNPVISTEIEKLAKKAVSSGITDAEMHNLDNLALNLYEIPENLREIFREI